MNIISKVLLALFILCSSQNAQDIFITDFLVWDYTIDPFTKEIYIDPSGGPIIKKSVYSTKFDTTDFPELPVFANKKHLASYSIENKIYFYDFDLDSNYLLFDSTLNWINLEFSPNDSAVIFQNTFHELNNYQIQKFNNYSSLFSDNYDEDNNGKFVWSSDSSIIRSGYDHSIIHYFIKSGKIDTLIEAKSDYQDYFPKPHLAYNDSLNAFAYSMFEDDKTILGLFDIATMANEVIHETIESDFEVDFTSLTWSPNKNKLAFIPITILASSGGLSIFDLEKSETFEIMHYHHNGFRSKDNLQWLNNDTILYLDERVLGIKADTSANVVNIKENKIADYKINISNYPNPFNPNTKIKYSLPEKGFVNISVFNSLGEKVQTLVNDFREYGIHEFNFSSNNLSSGTYFYVINFGNYTKVGKMLLLK